MYLELIRTYCLSKPFTEETFPFDETTVVYKVAGKMFCLGDIIDFRSINLKCDPEYAVELREHYDQITPGYHMSKKLWNTVELDQLNIEFVFGLIDHSYEEVVKKLPLKVRKELFG